jgi:uncharacterized membrane protein YqiK
MAKNPLFMLFEGVAICIFVIVLCLYTVTVVSTACVLYAIIVPFTGFQHIHLKSKTHQEVALLKRCVCTLETPIGVPWLF